MAWEGTNRKTEGTVWEAEKRRRWREQREEGEQTRSLVDAISEDGVT